MKCLKLSQDELDLLSDILIDASFYHHRLYEHCESMDVLAERTIFAKEKEYHSKATELCSELVWEIESLQKEDSE